VSLRRWLRARHATLPVAALMLSGCTARQTTEVAPVDAAVVVDAGGDTAALDAGVLLEARAPVEPRATFHAPGEGAVAIAASPTLECAWHLTWPTPPKWSVVRVDGRVVATAPHGAGILVRTSLPWVEDGKPGVPAAIDTRALAAELARWIDPAPSLSAPKTARAGLWAMRTTLDGIAGDAKVTVVIDHKAERSAAGHMVWIAAARGADASTMLDALAAAWNGARPLPDHACACGYDCAP